MYQESDREEKTYCDKCGKVMWFSEGIIFYIEDEPKLLCTTCSANQEIQRIENR